MSYGGTDPKDELLRQMLDEWKSTNALLQEILDQMRSGPQPLGPGQPKP